MTTQIDLIDSLCSAHRVPPNFYLSIYFIFIYHFLSFEPFTCNIIYGPDMIMIWQVSRSIKNPIQFIFLCTYMHAITS
jgi:hypothetical protein